jgi:hypothetical protein
MAGGAATATDWTAFFASRKQSRLSLQIRAPVLRYAVARTGATEQTRHKSVSGFAVGWHEAPADTTLLLRPRLGVGFASGAAHNTFCVQAFGHLFRTHREPARPCAGIIDTQNGVVCITAASLSR